MQEIANQIFIENSYPGVVVGFIQSADRLVLIDAPFRAEDQQDWRGNIKQFGNIKEKYLLLLDTHIDRTFGARAFDATIIAQKNAVDLLADRPSTIRRQDLEFGIDLEINEMPSNFHWPVPDIVFSQDLMIDLKESRVRISHQPGAHLAGCWLWHDAENIVFVGDSVVVNQPPFLAFSDLDQWIEEIRWLTSDECKGYKVINGRNGVVRSRSIEKMLDTLLRTREIVQRLDEDVPTVEKIDDAALTLLRKINYDRECKELYRNRLVWGFKNYLQRHGQSL